MQSMHPYERTRMIRGNVGALKVKRRGGDNAKSLSSSLVRDARLQLPGDVFLESGSDMST